MKDHDAFLSHNNKDKPIVEKIAEILEDEAKLRVFLDKWHMIPGDPWQEEVEAALEASHCCVVFLGPHGMGPWQHEEMRVALNDHVSDKSIRVLPVLLPGARKPNKGDIPKFLKRSTWVNYIEDDEEALYRLVCGIKGIKPGRFRKKNLPAPAQKSEESYELPIIQNLPYHRNACFVGRTDSLASIAQSFWQRESGSNRPLVAITGIGGMGKTQLACEYAYRQGMRYAEGVFWLSFADPELIHGEMAKCGLAMGFDAGFDRLSQEEQLGLVKRSWAEPGSRLFIFDNCEDEALLKQWSLAIGVGHVLVTTRRSKWSASLGVELVPLGILHREDSIQLLIKLCGALTPEEAFAIAEVLADLPLALHLAGCYLENLADAETNQTFLEALQSPKILDHFAMMGEGIEDKPTGHELNVAKTFALSYDKLDQANDQGLYAKNLLCRAACFAPGEPIPRKLLLATLQEEEVAAKHMAALGLKRLKELGLLVEMGTECLGLHRLLAAFVKKTLGDKELEAGQKAVEKTFNKEASQLNNAGDPRPLSRWSVHLKWVTDQSDTKSEFAAGLCNEFGYHSKMIGEYSAAKPYYEGALSINQKVLGDDHPGTAKSLNNLGSLLHAMGELTAAKPYIEQALAIRMQVLGDGHPDTANSLNNLGFLLKALGELAAAKPYYEQALSINQKVLGDAHPYTAKTLNNLGALLRATGELAAAKRYYEKALAIRKKVLGDTHPDTAGSLNNLGFVLNVMGELPAAKLYLEQALAIYQKVLGDAHPYTAKSLNNLGSLLNSMGELAAAKRYYEQALTIRKQVLGTLHPATATSLNNLGVLLQAMEELEAAKPYYEQALAIRARVLGDAHPATAHSLNNLASLLWEMGAHATAKGYYEKALAIRIRVLGDAHPDTVANYWDLLEISDECGDHDSVNQLVPALMWLIDTSDEELSATHRMVREQFLQWLEPHQGALPSRNQ